MLEIRKRLQRPAGRGRLPAALALGLAAMLTIAACGSDDNEGSDDGSGNGETNGEANGDGSGGGGGNGDATEGEEYSWSLGETHAEDYPTTQADIWFADELRERTGGRIDIDVFPSAQLGEERDVLEQVQLGAVEMTRTSAAPVSEFVSSWGLFSLPYIFDDDDHLWNFLDGEYGQQMLEDLREGSYLGLAYYASGSRNFYTTGTPVETPDDLAGQTIRVQPGALNADMIEAMGGSPVTMDFGEVYSALETGVIDGAENNEPSYVSTGHYETAKYFSLDGHQRVPEVLLISADVWDSLSAEDQQLIQEVAQESVDVQRELWDAEVEKSIAAIEEAGNEIIDVDVAQFQDAVADLLESYRDEFGEAFDAIDAAR